MGSYRPALWGTPSPSRVVITFPGQPQSSPYSGAVGGTASLPTAQTLYVFDAVFTVGHEQELRPTQHPVQSGASISDHAYIEPARLILDIGMSDVMDAFFNPSTWSGSSSKSVSAYQTLLAIQFSRIPITIATKLRTYTNMVIRSIAPQENLRTIFALRARIEFFQIFVATTLQTQNSVRPQVTGQTNLGSVAPQPKTAAEQSQNGIAGLTGMPAVPSTAIGAGQFSSVNVNNLSILPGK